MVKFVKSERDDIKSIFYYAQRYIYVQYTGCFLYDIFKGKVAVLRGK